MATQNECKEKWLELRQRILDEIKALDKETPWSESEPKWWLEMRQVQKEIIKTSDR